MFEVTCARFRLNLSRVHESCAPAQVTYMI